MLAVIVIIMLSQEFGRYLSSSLMNPMQRPRKIWVFLKCLKTYSLHLESQMGHKKSLRVMDYVDCGDVLTYICQNLPRCISYTQFILYQLDLKKAALK